MFTRILGILFLVSPYAAIAEPASSAFSDQEKKQLSQHATVELCYSTDFPPNLFLDKSGQPAGYIPELYSLLGKKMGINFTFRITPWPEAVKHATRFER